MSFSGANRVPKAPTLPQGETVAAYGTYLEAQKAVDHLADHQFPVQLVTIVGTDLRMVERVTGRLSYPRAALGGFLSGAWFGLFVGLLMSLFSTPGTGSLLPAAILIGGAFGLILSVVTYSFSGGKRDFTSSSQIVAATYSVLCRSEKANAARQLLAQVGGVTPGWGTATAATPAPPVAETPPPAPPTDPRG
ncbi:general stress protein [Cellulomonas soli]|uniref:general stress protein n=1 Tax=Cellulomonas soli TaxID=931535 RepID=UPI003F83EF1D